MFLHIGNEYLFIIMPMITFFYHLYVLTVTGVCLICVVGDFVSKMLLSFQSLNECKMGKHPYNTSISILSNKEG